MVCKLHFFIFSFFHFAKRLRWHKAAVHVGFRDEGTGVEGVLDAAHGEDTVVCIGEGTHHGHLVSTFLAALIRTCRQVKYKFTKITIYENYLFLHFSWRFRRNVLPLPLTIEKRH